MKQNKIKFGLKIDLRTLAILIGFSAVAVGITYILYTYTQTLLKQRLQERIIAIASTAATQIDFKDVERVRSVDDLASSSLKKLVDQLNAIKAANKNLRYVYIMRRTNDPLVLEFVADAEMLATEEELDTNGNGIVEDEESTPLPGDPFEIADYPVLLNEAFYHPAADRDLEKDQWSVQMSAYAPIHNASGDAVAIIGIDVIVDDFLILTRATLLPFLLFVLFLVFALVLLTLLLVRVWSEKVEAVKELDRQKDELISIVSHQLNTPVTSLKWELEMLTDGDMGKFNDEQIETLKGMQNITANLADLVGMILDVSRIQLGKMKISMQELDLQKFFEEILNVIDPKAQQQSVEFIKNIPHKLPTVFLDKRLTRMTIENLLSNAIKYTKKGGKVVLDVRIDSGKLFCKVKDNGCGIPKKDQSQIFGKLYRASNVRNNVDGNGFGLYIAKGAIESQDGKIWFESEENVGTTFFIELPLRNHPDTDDHDTH